MWQRCTIHSSKPIRRPSLRIATTHSRNFRKKNSKSAESPQASTTRCRNRHQQNCTGPIRPDGGIGVEQLGDRVDYWYRYRRLSLSDMHNACRQDVHIIRRRGSGKPCKQGNISEFYCLYLVAYPNLLVCPRNPPGERFPT